MYCTSRPKGHAHLCRMTPFLFVIDIAVILAAIYAFQVGTKTAIVCGAGLQGTSPPRCARLNIRAY